MDKYNSILIETDDNVITALSSIKKGEFLIAVGLSEEIVAKEDIAEGHKVAIKNIFKDTEIVKYGKVMGIALKDIDIGQLVHIHNVRSNRGKELRGDGNHAKI